MKPSPRSCRTEARIIPSTVKRVIWVSSVMRPYARDARDVLGQVLLDAISSALALDPLQAPELHRSAERVADRAAQKAPPDPRAIALEFLSFGHPTCGHEAPLVGSSDLTYQNWDGLPPGDLVVTR